MLNSVTFNFFVLHRPEPEVAPAVALLLLLLRPETNNGNESPLITFLFPDYPASCLFETSCALFKRTIIILTSLIQGEMLLWQETVKPCTLLYISLYTCAYNTEDNLIHSQCVLRAKQPFTSDHGFRYLTIDFF